MRPIIKRPSVLVNILGVVLAAFAFSPALIPMMQKEELKSANWLEIITGFLILWVTSFISTILQQTELAHNSNENHRAMVEQIEKLTDTIDLYLKFYTDEWGRKTLDSLAKIFEIPKSNVHFNAALQNYLDDFYTKTRTEINTPGFTVKFNKEKEFERLRWLAGVIRRAEKYVFAVTFDGGDYIHGLWDGEVTKEYLAANRHSRRKTVQIQRVFILEDDVFENEQHPKRKILNPIFHEHEKAKVKYCVVKKSDVGNDLDAYSTSFLVCDDWVGSESYSLSDKRQEPGYIRYNDREHVEQLKTRFAKMSGINNSNWRVRPRGWRNRRSAG